MGRNNLRNELPDNRRRWLNDPTGFWTRLAARIAPGWAKVLPLGTLVQVDRHAEAQNLQQLIAKNPVRIRWKKVEFDALLNDGDSSMPMESGGLGISGTVTLIFSKSSFAGNNYPRQKDVFKIQVRGRWKNFQVGPISEGFNDYDDALIATVQPEDGEDYYS